ncbi:MAG TPA: type IV secretion system DNA-binding domain-containing protein [Steroidobacteraceae bacterium]|nr:type IV secretion system DNA-binding domain-containing protein [Steroidobacteraceae bacterium]
MLAVVPITALTHGWFGVALAYASVQAPMLAGMLRSRAAVSRLLLSPVIAAPVTAFAGLGMALAGSALQALGLAPSGLLHLAAGGALYGGIGYLAGRSIGRAPAAAATAWHQRGAMVARADERATPRNPGIGAQRTQELRLAGLPVAAADETKHFKFIGTTGTGKSTAIAQLIGGALARGDSAVIADPEGGYLRRFYDAGRGDVILNPFDQRSVKWDLFAEIRHGYDVEQIARSLLPDHEGADRSWRGYARTFFTAVTRQAHVAGVRDVMELYRLLVVADTHELRTLTRGTPAQPFLDEHNGRMFDSIRSVTSSAAGALEYVAAQRSPPFSLRKWVERDRGSRGAVLFIPYRAGQIAALRSAISAWMRIAIFAAMDRAEHDQRLWFVVDELDALGQIDGLKDALARLRKFGGRCILGFQSISQVATTYGEGDAHTIVENCGNSMILRCSASEGGGTSRFASTLIGQREVRRATVSHSRRPTELFGTTTRSEHFSIEPAVMDSEIEQLPDLCGYLKFASRPEWLGVRLQTAARPGAAAVESPAHLPIELPTGAAMSAVAAAPARPYTPDAAALPRPFPGRRRSTTTRAGAQPPAAHHGVHDRRGARGRGADAGAAPDVRGPEP